MSFIIAIDGPAGSGKGTVTSLLSKRLNFTTMDTGAMYRSVTLYLLENNINVSDTETIEKALKEIKLDIKEVDGEKFFYLNSRDVSKEIRTKEVDNLVSIVSHIPCVRTEMVELQRKMAIGKNIIMEGRDIGTNVFPNAQVKIYLDATQEERARRRLAQNIENGISSNTYEEVLENVKLRDYNDKTSSIAPLKKADDAITIDTTNLNVEEVIDIIEKIVNERLGKECK